MPQNQRDRCPRGYSKRLRWGGYNKLCEIVDEAGNTTTVAYDLDGFPVELRNPKGEVHRYEHGPRGELQAEVTFDGRRISYHRDLVGRVVGITDADGRKSEFIRDLCGTVIERRLPDDLVEMLDYDARGDLIAARGAGVEILFERDGVGRVIRQTQVIDGRSYSVERAHRGSRHVMTTSQGYSIAMEAGSDLSTRRYLLGGSHEVLSTADAYGREVERRLPGGGVIQSRFDPRGRLAERNVTSTVMGAPWVRPGEPEWIGEQRGATTAHRAYRYDGGDRLIETWDAHRGATQYELDPIGQLLSVLRGETVTEAYRYDPSGNITAYSGDVSIVAAGNRLTATGATEYAYDALGQLTQKRTKTISGAESASRYVWDSAGRLSSVTSSDGTTVEFVYDPLGRRMQKRVSQRASPDAGPTLVSVTTFLWDGSVLAQEIKQTVSTSGDPIIDERSYWIAGDGAVPLAHRDVRHSGSETSEGDWIHYINDPNGAPTALVDARGQVVCELTRTAWGKTTVRPGAKETTQFRFMGQYEDSETGLHYNHFRYYDPETGRYLSHDPIGLRGGHNLFRYVSDPNSLVDRFGLGPCHCVMLTNNGPPERRVGTDANGNGLYAWRRNSGGSPANVHPDIEAHIPPAAQLPPGSTANPDQRAKCAEPATLTDYRNWLAAQPNPGNQPMLSRIQQGVVAVVPMEQRGPTRGAHKPPCDFCGPTLGNMGLSNRVMTPGAAAAAMPGVPADVFTVQPVPVFR